MMSDYGKSKDKVDYTEYTGQYNDLSRRILKYCCSCADGKNVVISPLSVLLLLAIAADSAVGRTREEILSFLGSTDAGQILGRLQKDLAADHSLSVANVVCTRLDIASSIRKSYKDLILPRYDAKYFASADLVKDVNGWIRDKTDGLISEAVSESIRDALMCLISAVAFDGLWLDPYEDKDVRDRYFTNADGTKSRVWMLYGTEHEYIENNDFTGFTKSYRDSNLSFFALLPKKKGEAAMDEALERIDFTGLCHSGSFATVHTCVPEFKVAFEQELSGLCVAFGINDLFTDYADFSPASSERLKAESIRHNAFIEVNQSGTKAAAVTVAYMVGSCCPPARFKEVRLDRPFVFAIVNREKSIPVFTGVVRHLEDAKENPERLKRKLRRNRQLWAE